MIVIRGNPASEYYSSYCKPSWNQAGINVKTFDAVTPATIPRDGPLTFSQYSGNAKYLKRNIKADITKTEQACWYSHFSLWEISCYENKPMMILEHDTYLEHPDKLWYTDKHGMIFYDKAAMGSYCIQPWFARRLVPYAMNSIIDSGPYGFIYGYTRRAKCERHVVNDVHPKYVSCSNQVMSDKYGNTIDHWCNQHPEYFPAAAFHKFKVI